MMMKKAILRWIYNRYLKEFQDIFIDAMLLSIPEKIYEPALEVMAKQRTHFVRWIYFEANSIFRRSPTDFGGAERRNGMLILLHALLIIIGRMPSGAEDHPVVGATKPPPEDWKKAQEGIKKFIDGAPITTNT